MSKPVKPDPVPLPAAFTALTGQFAWAGGANGASYTLANTPAAPRPAAQLDRFAAAEAKLRTLTEKLPPQMAAAMLQDHIKANPEDPAGYAVLAQSDIAQRRYAPAAVLLEHALELAPRYSAARKNYVAVLLAMGKAVEALPHVEQLVAAAPQDTAHRICLAWCLGQIGEYDRSIALYDELLDEIGEQPKYALHYADILKYAGHRDDAVHVYRSCIAHVPSLGDAWWSLANMKNVTLTADDIAAMRAQLDRAEVGRQDRIPLHYALGRALEQEGDYAQSFAHYAKGAALKRAAISYDGSELPKLMERSKAFFSAPRLAGFAGKGCPDPAPIFIVGLPRAGSTLIEQILASHSAVEGTQELPEISNIVRDIGEPKDGSFAFKYPDCLAKFTTAEIAALGQRYIDRTRIYRKTGRPFFIDKMPANWAHAALIHTILPNAKIIDARRHAMGTCFSAFKQLFGHGVHYSYDLTELGRYYAAYVARMAHFDAVMPGRIHRVEYENMIADPETEIRALLAYCDLPFEPGCLRFWESTRAVATPSSEQVRQPIYRDGLEQWRHFAPYLDKLAAALAE
jgi:tetratricopeptide (TPR) repeat protein